MVIAFNRQLINVAFFFTWLLSQALSQPQGWLPGLGAEDGQWGSAHPLYALSLTPPFVVPGPGDALPVYL